MQSVNEEQVKIYVGEAELMSELFFASKEPGNNYITQPYILNTALYYALGFAKSSYINFPDNKRSKKQKPQYIEDTENIYNSIYITPASPVNDVRYSSENSNSRGDQYVQYNKLEKQVNSPTGKIGKRKQIQPETIFRFFILSYDGLEPELPSYIRIGKKRTKAKLTWNKPNFKIGKGDYTLNHPILIDDLSVIPKKDISFQRMVPFDLIKKGRLNGEYFAINLNAGENTFLPSDLRFLQRRRDDN